MGLRLRVDVFLDIAICARDGSKHGGWARDTAYRPLSGAQALSGKPKPCGYGCIQRCGAIKQDSIDGLQGAGTALSTEDCRPVARPRYQDGKGRCRGAKSIKPFYGQMSHPLRPLKRPGNSNCKRLDSRAAYAVSFRENLPTCDIYPRPPQAQPPIMFADAVRRNDPWPVGPGLSSLFSRF